jgi:hypothetical protein
MAMRSHRINQAETFSEPVPKKGTKQWNLVVIAVDQLTAPRASLIGVWLLITSPGNDNITLVPIYPTGDLTSGPKNVAWDEMFSIDSEQTPSIEFLSTLSEHILWDEYLLIDQEGITNIVNQFTQFKSTSQANEVKGNTTISTGSIIELNLEGQFEIWQAVCSELAAKSDPNEVSIWLDQIKPFTHSGFELKDQLNFQKKSQFQLVCEFPTLTLNSP